MLQHTCNILVVEDDDGDRALYRRFLKDRESDPTRYILHEVATGQEGLDFFEHEHPDCILLDFALPDMTGVDFINTLAQTNAILPVVMLTGQGKAGAPDGTLASSHRTVP